MVYSVIEDGGKKIMGALLLKTPVDTPVCFERK
jgi:hypothetical protein